MKTKTPEQVRHDLKKRGKTIPQLAKEIGHTPHNVRAVLYGHCKGNFGEAHKIVVALGLKERP